MPVLIKHPIFLPAYQRKKETNQDKVGDKAPLQTPVTFFIAQARYPLRFWQTMVFGSIVLLLVVVALLILLGLKYATPMICWLAYFFIIGNNMTVRFNDPYRLPLPFLGGVSDCQARPLVTLYTDRIEWHITPVDTSVDDGLRNDFNITSKLNGCLKASCLTNTNFANNLTNNATHHNIKNATFVYLPSVVQTWDFNLNAPNGIHRMDVTDKLVVYFARIVSLDGTPCCFNGQETLLINTDNSYQRLTFGQFCQWVNDRICYFRKTYDSSDETTNHSP